MEKQLTAEDARQSLNAHVAAKGCELFLRHGAVSYAGLTAVLQDRTLVRYPCEIAFDSSRLNPGEFAHAEQKGEHPEDGFTIWVHPIYLTQLPKVPYLVYYQLVVVNYGEFASPQDAETFGAAALGLTVDEYYAEICELADLLGAGIDPGTGMGCGAGFPHACGG